jgi:capsular polysaccharide biosynthesis protein
VRPVPATAGGWEIRDVLRILFKRAWIFPVVAGTCLVSAAVAIQFLTPLYQAKTRLLVAGGPKIDSPFYRELPPLTGFAATHSEVLKSQDFLKDVVLWLNLYMRDEQKYDSPLKQRTRRWASRSHLWAKDRWTAAGKLWGASGPVAVPPAPDPVVEAVERLQKRIEIQPLEKTEVLEVSVSDPDPQTAEDVGNLLARFYVLYHLKQQVKEQSVRYGESHPLNRQLNDIIAVLSRDPVKAGSAAWRRTGTGPIKIVQNARAGTQPRSPQKAWILWGSLAGGVLGSLFLIFLFERLDPAVRRAEDMAALLPVPLVGTVPRRIWAGKKIRREEDLDLEPFLPLAQQIESLRQKAGARTLCFYATEYTESNAQLVQTISLCLSRLKAGDGSQGQVLLVEPEINGNRFLWQPLPPAQDRKTLSDCVRDPSAAKQAVCPVDPSLSISVIDGARALGRPPVRGMEQYRAFLDSIKDVFDVVLLWGPGPSRRHDFLFLNGLCDGTFLIVNEERTRRRALESMVNRLEVNNVKVLGAILNDQLHPIPGLLYSWV